MCMLIKKLFFARYYISKNVASHENCKTKCSLHMFSFQRATKNETNAYYIKKELLIYFKDKTDSINAPKGMEKILEMSVNDRRV